MLKFLLISTLLNCVISVRFPIVVNTWGFSNATKKAYEVLNQQGKSAIDAVVEGCSVCEVQQCDGSVGYGGSPNEEGETTLDSMVMDGKTMKVGAVAGLRHIKEAIALARHVLDYTKHTLLVGDQATEFAIKMGFARQNLSTSGTDEIIDKWKRDNCQPNFWMNVSPNADESCGPYEKNENVENDKISVTLVEDRNHDTIGMLAIDADGNIAAGTSTNGLTYKIPGRVGDTPIPGCGAYADNTVGGAAATGDGDIIMRFSGSFLAVELLRNGYSPQQAAEIVIDRIGQYYPENRAAIVVLDMKGNYGAACQIFNSFPISIYHPELNEVKIEVAKCRQIGEERTTPGSGSINIIQVVVIILMVIFVVIF